jgi:hypothetical protein
MGTGNKKKRAKEEKKIMSESHCLCYKDNCWIELMCGEVQWVPILFIAYCWCKYWLCQLSKDGNLRSHMPAYDGVLYNIDPLTLFSMLLYLSLCTDFIRN